MEWQQVGHENDRAAPRLVVERDNGEARERERLDERRQRWGLEGVVERYQFLQSVPVEDDVAVEMLARAGEERLAGLDVKSPAKCPCLWGSAVVAIKPPASDCPTTVGTSPAPSRVSCALARACPRARLLLMECCHL